MSNFVPRAHSAEDIAKSLGGRKAGSGWTACCPAHHDRNPSLSIRTAHAGKVLIRCHAGCNQDEVIRALRQRGLWTDARPWTKGSPVQIAPNKSAPDGADAKRTELALSIWRTATVAQGTL